ncbi:RNB domain-containing ribonuclease [Kocuria atrinae]|uniref:RNB domain-containing ribonuclease n=1 Tax=Kocuria atrinae TaxID=592377 RepID=UPI001CB8B78F|nr:RNB domain-containing ribonuclease [Kocuria atrinae]
MPIRPHQVQAVPKPLVEGLEKLRQDLDIPEDFAPEVHDAARHAASNPRLPEVDRTDLEFVTVDPEGSRDLDQAVFIEATETGFTVWYAIADVAAFVNPGDPIDVEAHVRGQTLYGPHQRTPLHPPELSEDAASLLENETRPAVLWQLTLDATGHQTARTVQRALIRSRAQLTYREVQDALDNGTASESLQFLKTVGQLREQIEHERGGVSLQIPEQEVETSNGEWHIVHRSALPVEGWNARSRCSPAWPRRRSCSSPGSACSVPCHPPTTLRCVSFARLPSAAHRVALRDGLPRIRAHPGSGTPRSRGHAVFVHAVVPRGRVFGLQR